MGPTLSRRRYYMTLRCMLPRSHTLCMHGSFVCISSHLVSVLAQLVTERVHGLLHCTSDSIPVGAVTQCMYHLMVSHLTSVSACDSPQTVGEFILSLHQ
ncbi:hypothetical protein K466DRAFT_591592 [Polyporus arcularius HHB13444]|uniref:Uncharacterized protein n=1 Tax=Polyporus arcularius HHB13444 TaxID=1314778 RepID=A0A5C3NVV2_9APHY|nr:hypothetical protein K466DRAFT_591592 [Polyporus arcularius HHB13444]